MRTFSLNLLAACLLTSFQAYAEEASADQVPAQTQTYEQPAAPFQPFTGKVVKNKVRLRSQPNLDAPIVRELGRGDMVIIDGEADGFYVVMPPKDTKAYVFRTFILDNVVEGSKVNIRLAPDVEAPAIGQLNSGDRIEGSVSPINSKWLEITPPQNIRFYVAKEYVDNIGDTSTMARLDKRRNEVNQLVDSSYVSSQNELQKPFEEIKLDQILANLNKVINQYTDFPEQVARAKEMQKSLQESYLSKKIQYLESKTKQATETWQSKNQQMAQEMQNQKERLKEMESKLDANGQKSRQLEGKTIAAQDALPMGSEPQVPANREFSVDMSEPMTPKMSQWESAEERCYQDWLVQHPNQTMQEYYQNERQKAVVVKGIVEQYNRPVKNRPGDYVLLNPNNNLPIAFLYSTKLNLETRVGQEQSFIVVTRPNNNFAFPAYFVIGVE
jgi:hypothetical protein